MGNLVSPSADEPDNRRAPTSTAELPTERDNDAAPALGARPNQEREPAARHMVIPYFEIEVGLIIVLRRQLTRKFKIRAITPFQFI